MKLDSRYGLYLSLLFVVFSAEASKYEDYSLDSYEQCFVGKFGDKAGSEMLTCLNFEKKGHGFIFLTVPKKLSKLKPMICHSRTSYRVAEEKIEIRSHKGSCPRGWWTKFHKFQCIRNDVGNLSCENNKRKFELFRVDKN